MPGRKSNAKGKKSGRTTGSSRANIIFPVGRVNSMFKRGRYSEQVGKGAGVFAAAVLEYLCREIVELAGNAAIEAKKARIVPRHIQLAIGNDEELNKVIAETTIAAGGVLPNVQGFLFAKQGKSGKGAVTSATQEM